MSPADVLAWGPVLGALVTVGQRIADRVRARRAQRRREHDAAVAKRCGR